MTLADRVREIKDRCEKATKGPWFAWLCTTDFVGWTVQIGAGWLFKQSDKCGPHDAEFVAHAREDIPFLLAELDRLTQERETEGTLEQAVARKIAEEEAQHGGLRFTTDPVLDPVRSLEAELESREL